MLEEAGLRARELRVVAVGVEVGGERALEVGVAVGLYRGRTMMSRWERKLAAQEGEADRAPRRARVDSSPAGSFPWTEPWIHTRTLEVELVLLRRCT